MPYPFNVITLEVIDIFVEKLSAQDEAKLDASILAISYGKYDTIYVKPLKGDLRELIIKKFRFIFFIKNETVYFISVFIKKTNKTPKQEIEKAEKIYKLIIKNN